MATYAIGDIQGCYNEFMHLIDRVKFDPKHDVLWLVGDLVNRGPDSLGVLRFVKGLGERAVSVLGNHDLHLLALASGAQVQPDRDASLMQVLDASDADDILNWLRYRPLLHHDPELDFVMIHAGLPPQWDLDQARNCALEVQEALRSEHYRHFLLGMYGDEPAQWSNTLVGRDRLRFITNCLTRLRYCDDAGRLALRPKGAPGSQPDHLLPWFKLDQRLSRGCRIVFGHWSTLGCHFADGVYALDSGCLWGGQLTALRLDDLEVFSVPCQAMCAPGGGFAVSSWNNSDQ